MRYSAEFSIGASEIRSEDRAGSAIAASVGGPIRREAVLVENFSTYGCMIRYPKLLPDGMIVALRLDSIGTHHAEVMWSDGDRTGFRFAEPLTGSQLAKLRSLERIVDHVPLGKRIGQFIGSLRAR